jgi:hypothetical protein
MNKEKIYNGSKICLLSAQLFLIAGIYNIYHKNIIIGFLLLLLYISSSIYHYNGNHTAKNIDIVVVYISSCICILISLYNRNLIPLFFLVIAGTLYNHNDNKLLEKLKDESMIQTHPNMYHLYDMIYHSLIHFTIFIGTMTLIYNTKKI